MSQVSSPQDMHDSRDRPIVVTSVVEMVILHALGWIIYSYFTPAMHTSPRQDELFWWAPVITRFWLLSLLLAAFNGPVSCVFPWLAWALLPGAVRRRFPLHPVRSSPRFVGAIIGTLFTISLLVGLTYLASFED